MSETKHEIAQIREITHEVGRFGGIMRLLFVAERTTHEGTETIAMSNEFEWQKDKKVPEQQLERATRRESCTIWSCNPCSQTAGSRSALTRRAG